MIFSNVDPNAKSPYQVVLEGDDDDLERLKVEVDDGRLEIETKRSGWSWSWGGSRKLRIRTTVKSLKELASAGSGDVKICASGDVSQSTMGSGDVDNVCD